MDVKGSVWKTKHDSAPEHKKKKRRRYSSSDSTGENISSTASDSHSNALEKSDQNECTHTTFESAQKHEERELKRKKKEKKHKHKKGKLKKEKKKKSKKHKLARKETTEYDNAKMIKLNTEPSLATVEQPKTKRVMAPMTREAYEKQQSIMKHVLDPETGRYRLIKGDGEVMEEIVSHSRHKEINKQSTKGDGATFQRMLGLG